MFGDGATYQPEDELHLVNNDITGLKAGATCHYRLVAFADGKTLHGPDQTFTVPADDKPVTLTGTARRITPTTALLEGRLNPMGLPTNYYFEYGTSRAYDSRTESSYGGRQITPRTVLAPLTNLPPGRTIHYRLVGVNATGTTRGQDGQFKTGRK